VLPTAIDTKRFHPAAVRPSQGPVLGWVGHSDNLRYLEGLAGPLREVARRHPGLRIIVVADRPCTLPGLDVEFRPWSLSSEISCFDGIRVGLMPLADDPWTRSKCAFKAIQYMALGIPTIASPVGMNRDVIRDGESGFLPEDDAAWVRVIDALLTDEALTLRIGLGGRRVVERGYALEQVSRALVTLLRGLVR
jgi:glycosyltransferase involved in cell wall biosynthesis